MSQVKSPSSGQSQTSQAVETATYSKPLKQQQQQQQQQHAAKSNYKNLSAAIVINPNFRPVDPPLQPQQDEKDDEDSDWEDFDLNQFYDDEYRDTVEQLIKPPKKRIMNERTGRLDHVFRGSTKTKNQSFLTETKPPTTSANSELKPNLVSKTARSTQDEIREQIRAKLIAEKKAQMASNKTTTSGTNNIQRKLDKLPVNLKQQDPPKEKINKEPLETSGSTQKIKKRLLETDADTENNKLKKFKTTNKENDDDVVYIKTVPRCLFWNANNNRS